MDIDTTKKHFEKVLNDTLPKFYTEVIKYKHFDNSESLIILISAFNKLINNVKGQYPQLVSLIYDIDTEVLDLTYYQGCGGKSIYVKPQKNFFLHMESIKIPFRKTSGLDKSLRALEKFLMNYKKALSDNHNILMYQDIVNYDNLLA